LLLTLNVGPNEKFPMHSRSFVAKAKLTNCMKTGHSPAFQIQSKPRDFTTAYTWQAFLRSPGEESSQSSKRKCIEKE